MRVLQSLTGGIFAVGLSALLASSSSGTVTIYDSAGFESPRFNLNPLVDTSISPFSGQDQVVIPGPPLDRYEWGIKGNIANFAEVTDERFRSGSQSVRLDRTVADQTWYLYSQPLTAMNPTVLGGNRSVTVEWGQYTVPSTHSNDFGPFLGVDVYGSTNSSTLPLRIGGFGVDAKTGELLYLRRRSGFADGVFDVIPNAANPGVGVTVPFNQWNDFSMTFDYLTTRYSMSVNGNLLLSNVAFIRSSGVTKFNDADLAALPADFEGGNLPIQTGTAYFDDLKITAQTVIPEPTTLTAVTIPLVALLRRRRGN